MKNLTFCLIILYLSPNFIFAQENDTLNDGFLDRFSLQFNYQNGYVFPTNKFIKGINSTMDGIDAIQAFSLNFSTQTKGDKLWEQLFKYPNYGFGLYTAGFQRPKEVGNPVGFYGFFNAPFVRWNRLSFNYELSFGATFNWKKYDPILNKYNTAIGAGKCFLVDAGLNLRYELTEKINLVGGFTLTHFSNGALKIPNQGINTIAPKLALRYNFYEKPEFVEQEVKKYKPNNEWNLTLFAGAKNVVFDSVNVDVYEKYEGVNYPVFGTSLTYNRQISYKSKFGIGTSVSYNGTIDAQVAADNNELFTIKSPFSDKLQVSIFPSYELVVNKVSLILQPSFYLYRKNTRNQSPLFYQKIGLKYHVTEKLFFGITLRDYSFHVSDFIEWNIGYRFRDKEG